MYPSLFLNILISCYRHNTALGQHNTAIRWQR